MTNTACNTTNEVEEFIHRVTTGQIKLETALVIAAFRQPVHVVKMLLERGADVNALDDHSGKTPLIASIIGKKALESVPLLLKHGADIRGKSASCRNVFHWLSSYNYQRTPEQTAELVRLFAPMVDVLLHESDRRGFKPIHLATFQDGKDLMKFYLDHGANVNALTNDGESLLTIAARTCYGDNTVILKMLLERGANLHHKTNAGRTALHKACMQYDEKNVELLLSAGADVLVEDNDGFTPFSYIHSYFLEKNDITPMIKALALKRIYQPEIELKDESIMYYKYTQLWNYYRDCIVYHYRMCITRFSEGCTFFDLFAKSREQVAALMRNPDLEANFWLYDLSGFSMYAKDILGAFERAQCLCRFMLERENVINEAVYHTLPDLVVRKVVRYLCDSFEKDAFY